VKSRKRTSTIVLSVIMSLGLVIFAQPAQAGTTTFQADAALNAKAMLAADSLAPLLTPPPSVGLVGSTSNEDNGFAGEAITAQGLEISLAPTVRGLTDPDLPTSVNGVPIVVRHVVHSQTQLLAVTDAINVDRLDWNAKSNTAALSTWGPDYGSNKVVVHLTNYSADVGAAIEAKYGSSLVSVATDGVVYRPATGTRKNDTTPWHGAALLCTVAATNCYGAICTSWFSVYAGSTSIDLTSGHCGTHTWVNGTNTVGGTSTMAYPNRNLDAQEINVSSNQAYVFNSANSARRVAGKTTSGAVGGLFCTDGYTDGEVCNVRIDSVNQTNCYDGQCTTGTVLAHQLNNIHAFSGGDSGGPVYNTQGDGSVLARGMIDSNNASNPAYGAYTPIAAILGNWNITLRIA